MRLKRVLLTGILGILASSVMFVTAHAAGPEGQTYYTKTNIWYEDASEPIIINYHRGTMIPAGTKVKIDAFKKDTIRFTTDSKVSLTLSNARKYSTISLQELFDRNFSKDDVLGWNSAFSKFSKNEKDHIKKGEIAEEMSKEAVIMAYGYPPSHRTPDLKSDTWSYWDSRFISYRVVFVNNRMNRIERGRRE